MTTIKNTILYYTNLLRPADQYRNTESNKLYYDRFDKRQRKYSVTGTRGFDNKIELSPKSGGQEHEETTLAISRTMSFLGLAGLNPQEKMGAWNIVARFLRKFVDNLDGLDDNVISLNEVGNNLQQLNELALKDMLVDYIQKDYAVIQGWQRNFGKNISGEEKALQAIAEKFLGVKIIVNQKQKGITI